MSFSSCDDNSCAPPTKFSIATLFSLTPFLATFGVVFIVSTTRLFPKLSHFGAGNGDIDDGEEHFLPASAPVSLKQAHHERYLARSTTRRRAAAAAFGATVGLAAVLAELILAEIVEVVDPRVREVVTRGTIGALVLLLVIVIPALETRSFVDAVGLGSWMRGDGRKGLKRFAWAVQLLVFGGWLAVFWTLGRAVPEGKDSHAYVQGEDDGSFDASAVTIASARGATAEHRGFLNLGPAGLSRACLERIGVIGISLMALLSGFASVSTPWHTFIDDRAYKRRPVTDADIARKQVGLDATSEMLVTKRHRLRALERKLEASSGVSKSSSGLMGKMIGSLKGIGSGGGDAAEIKALQVEITGLEAMEASLRSSLSLLRSRQAAHARDGTALGKLLSLPTYGFSIYCIYRILATGLTSLRRVYHPYSSFSSSDPINRFLGLIARHWDPKLDQIAWARQISFLLSGVILAASANSVLQTFHIFARWAPGLLRQAQANLALIIGQIAATYVIAAALLMRSNLPHEVGRSVSDALESALEPAFVDRWFEGWFLLASALTMVGIWIGRQIGGSGMGEWDDWEELGMEELGQKRS